MYEKNKMHTVGTSQRMIRINEIRSRRNYCIEKKNPTILKMSLKQYSGFFFLNNRIYYSRSFRKHLL